MGKRRTDGHKLSLVHRLPDLLEQQGVVLLEPLELLSLRRDEPVLGVAGDQVELGRPRAARARIEPGVNLRATTTVKSATAVAAHRAVFWRVTEKGHCDHARGSEASARISRRPRACETNEGTTHEPRRVDLFSRPMDHISKCVKEDQLCQTQITCEVAVRADPGRKQRT